MLHHRAKTSTVTHHASRLAVVGLALFHAYLLVRRVVDGGLFSTDVALRWLGSAAVVLAAAWLRGRGISLVRGRSAATFWLVVLLLHAGVGAPPITAAGAILESLPLGTFGLLALPAIGFHVLADQLRALAALVAGHAPRPAVVPVARTLRATLSPARDFAPLRRRPPPA